MGYYTNYSIALYGKEEDCEAFEQELLDKSKDKGGVADSDLEELLNYCCVHAKLYDVRDWIDEVAPHHPNVLICLSGDGEESDDNWEARWKGNEHETQKAVIPPFNNPSLLLDNEKDETKNN